MARASQSLSRHFFTIGALVSLAGALVAAAMMLGSSLYGYLTFPDVIPVSIGALAILSTARRMDRRAPFRHKVAWDAFAKPFLIFFTGAGLGALASLLVVTFFPHDLMTWAHPDGPGRVLVSFVLIPFAWLMQIGIPGVLVMGPLWFLLGRRVIQAI